MYTFNASLFLSLPTLLHTTKRQIGIAVSNSNWYVLAYQNPNVFVRKLVTLCNIYHIDIRSFFGQDIAPIILPACVWKPITFHPSRLKQLYAKDSSIKIHQKDILVDVPVSKLTFMQWVNDQSSAIKIDSLLRICNLYDINPDFFFDNPNSTVDIPTLLQNQEKLVAKLELQLSNAKSILSELQTT